MTNLINSNELLNKAIYCIIALFFTLVFLFSKTIYNSNLELQKQIQEMSTIMSKLTFTIDNTNYLFQEVKNDLKEIKKEITKQDKEILLIKSKVK